jgi:hypothetical protein
MRPVPFRFELGADVGQQQTVPLLECRRLAFLLIVVAWTAGERVPDVIAAGLLADRRRR